MNSARNLLQCKKSQLASGLRRVPVRFTRPFEPGSNSGYVLDTGPEFFLLAQFGDGLRFDGFSCFRYRDVRNLEVPARHAAFVKAALRKRGQKVPKNPRVDISSVQNILNTASLAFPLITIHRENINADIVQIGNVFGFYRSQVALLEIDPDARWDDEPKIYAMKEITRIQFGGDYEDALQIVGGARHFDPDRELQYR